MAVERPPVPLWVKSNASFLEGASHPEELVERAHELGYPALTLTDRDGMYGIVRAHVRARELGVRLIIGAQLTVALRPAGELASGAEPTAPVIALARTRAGYGALCRAITVGRSRRPKGQSLLYLDDLARLAGEVVVLTPHPEPLPALREAFGSDVFALCARHLEARGHEHEHALRQRAAQLGVPTVAAVEVLYHHASRRPLQDVLTCIRTKTRVHAAGAHIRPNAEHELPSPAALRERFADDPAALERTREIAERCTFGLEGLRYVYPRERVPEGRSLSEWLRELTFRGAEGRYGGHVPAPVRAQLDRELAVIDDLDYGGYFLTMWEIVEFCRAQRILCQGRGSAANSAVCFCLGITAVDPVRMDLLFERFLSRERAEPPDIDLDIEHHRREEVVQWVYERRGRRHAAMVANVIRYRARSAVRDVGKALGLPQTGLDRVAKLLSPYDATIDPQALERAGLDPGSPAVGHLLRLCNELADFPRHLSIHPGGFLLGSDPVDTLVPVEPATMEGRTVAQWDKYDVEALGLFKVDLLALGGLTQIRGCLELMRVHEGVDLQMATVPHEDPLTYAMISRADTVGVFQIESRAQMAMLPRLRPRTFYDLVIEVAIVRPGPIQGDMVHPYLRRRNGEEPVDFPHPAVQRVLAKTLGVPIFQEQVMKLAVLVADYTPGEADQLRRDMAAWRSSGKIEQHRARIVGRMIQNGITPEYAERVFSQIRGFGEYGFPESHAASFALIAYVTAWLRCHHLPAFTCALLNAQPMGFYSPATIVEDAQRHGVEVRPVDVQRSAWDCTLEPRPGEGGSKRFAVRMGLRFVRGLGAREHTRLAAAPGPYADLREFVRRVGLGRGALTALAEAGAFTGFGLDRRAALWALRGLAITADDALEALDPAGAGGGAPAQFAPIDRHAAVLWDYRSSLHSTRGHPIEALRAGLRRRRVPTAEQLSRLGDGQRTTYVGVVICRQRPATASGVTFMTLEDETGFVNLVVWRDVFERHATVAKTATLLEVRGTVQRTEGVVHLIAASLHQPELEWEAQGTRSRDFH